MKQSREFISQIWQNEFWPRRYWLLCAFSIITLLLAAGLILSRWQSASGQSGPAAAGNANADQNFIQGLQQALNNSRLTAAERQALLKKLEYSERLAAQRMVKPQAHQPKGALIPPVEMPQPEIISPSMPEERIIPGSEGLVHPWEASINNLWEGAYNGKPYQVLAGSAPDNPSQGLIIMIESSSTQGQPFQHTYQALVHSGALQIVSRQNGRLQCAAADGSTLFFDLESRTFQP